MKTISIIVLSLLVCSTGLAKGQPGVNPFAAYQKAKADGTYVPKAKGEKAKKGGAVKAGGHAAAPKLNTSGHSKGVTLKTSGPS